MTDTEFFQAVCLSFSRHSINPKWIDLADSDPDHLVIRGRLYSDEDGTAFFWADVYLDWIRGVTVPSMEVTLSHRTHHHGTLVAYADFTRNLGVSLSEVRETVSPTLVVD